MHVEWAYQGVIPVRRRRGERDLDGLGGRLALLWLGQRLNHLNLIVAIGLRAHLCVPLQL